MKITLGELKACEKGLSKIMGADLPAISSFRLLSILDIVNVALTRLEEVRINLVKKHGIKDETKGSYTIPKDSPNWTTFMDELGAVLQEEINLEGYIPMDITHLGNTNISAIELKPLIDRFVVEEKPTQAGS